MKVAKYNTYRGKSNPNYFSVVFDNQELLFIKKIFESKFNKVIDIEAASLRYSRVSGKDCITLDFSDNNKKTVSSYKSGNVGEVVFNLYEIPETIENFGRTEVKMRRHESKPKVIITLPSKTKRKPLKPFKKIATVVESPVKTFKTCKTKSIEDIKIAVSELNHILETNSDIVPEITKGKIKLSIAI